MRYAVIGAGAVGGALGGRLAEAGHEVLLVARGDHCRALRAGGLRLLTPGGELTLRLPVAERPDEAVLRPDDVLLLATKTQDTAAALSAWGPRPVAGGGSAAELLPVFCAQNGVENERLALRTFRRVYGVCVWLPATHLEPGVVIAEGAPKTGLLNIGRYPEGVDPLVERVVADLCGAQIVALAEPAVMRWKYGKLLANLGNALEAVCGGFDPTWPVARLLHEEGVAVLAAAGIAAVGQQEQDQVRGDQVQIRPVAGAARAGGSSWQSLRRGARSIEADYLNGEIALLGRLHGVPTPVNDTLQRVAGEFAAAGRFPGTMPMEALTRMVDEARERVAS